MLWWRNLHDQTRMKPGGTESRLEHLSNLSDTYTCLSRGHSQHIKPYKKLSARSAQFLQLCSFHLSLLLATPILSPRHPNTHRAVIHSRELKSYIYNTSTCLPKPPTPELSLLRMPTSPTRFWICAKCVFESCQRFERR